MIISVKSGIRCLGALTEKWTMYKKNKETDGKIVGTSSSVGLNQSDKTVFIYFIFHLLPYEIVKVIY